MGSRTGILLAAFFAILAGVGLADAQKQGFGARRDVYATGTWRQEGDSSGRVFFSVTCASGTVGNWTVVVASEPTRRSILMMAPAANAGGVCLSSSTQTGACADSTPGPEVVANSGLTDYSTGEWSCRSRAGNSDTIKGYASRHSQDF